MKKRYAVFLQPNPPAELLSILADYLLEHEGMKYFLALDVVSFSFFVEFAVVEQNKQTEPWNMQFSPNYVLAIVDMTTDNSPFGFLSSLK